MGYPGKTQAENGLENILDFWGHNIDVSDQAILILEDMSFQDEEGNKINTSDPLTGNHR